MLKHLQIIALAEEYLFKRLSLFFETRAVSLVTAVTEELILSAIHYIMVCVTFEKAGCAAALSFYQLAGVALVIVLFIELFFIFYIIHI